jgi:hypothetical protein
MTGWVIINPGAGPVGGRVSLRNALKNMTRLKRDARLPRQPSKRRPWWDEGGRYGFEVRNSLGRKVTVLMPGVPLRHVRWMGGDCWPYPRLYVNGNSWLWRYAVEILAEGIE